MKGLIHSKDTFGTLDGPGIRYVLFLKGCQLRCAYCHNPDTWAINSFTEMSAKEVLDDVLKYKNYYTNGGITISGGEPLLQIDFLIELTKMCKEKGISTAIDTSGCTFDETNIELLKKFEELIKYVDLFLLDIKHIDEHKCINLTGKTNKNTLNFAKYLNENKVKMWIRYVLVPGYTDDLEDLRKTSLFINSMEMVQKIELLPYHTLGAKKYKELHIPYRLEEVRTPNKEEIELAKQILKGVK